VQLLLVRHGHPLIERNDDRIADPGLSELGAWQSMRLVEWLRHEPIDAVITSPKRRAIDTVRPLIDDGLPHDVVEGLDEIDRLSRIYLPTELFMSEGGDYLDAVRRGDWEAVGWDPPEVFRERVWAAFAAICEQRPGGHVVVACHGGTIRNILGGCFPGLADAVTTVEYASISRIELTEAGTHKLLSYNETAHYDADRTGLVGPMRDGRPASWR
jgi:2,3-bisphosphoglycerate-dependent phosphoglycerate mutase